jgi:hypothetical protein
MIILIIITTTIIIIIKVRVIAKLEKTPCP